VVATAVAELVVQDTRPPGPVQLGDRLDAVVRPAGSAVADDDRRAQRVRVELADDPVPRAVAVAFEMALHHAGT
jgi:hypothetical protein